MNIKVLGPGCRNCITLERVTREAVEALGIEVEIEKVTDYAAVAQFGIASTPGIVIDGKVVHAGGLPKSADLTKWLQG